MKKSLILCAFIFLLTGIENIHHSKSVVKHLDADGKPENWEKWDFFKANFLKEKGRLVCFNRSVRLELRGGYTQGDSVAVAQLVDELNGLMESQKISFVPEGGNYVFELDDKYKTALKTIIWNGIYYRKRCVHSFIPDSIRVNYLKSQIIRGLVFKEGVYVDEHHLCNNNVFSNSNSREAIFSDLDRFIISKAYSKDYKNQIKSIFPGIFWERYEENGYIFTVSLLLVFLLAWYFYNRGKIISTPRSLKQYYVNGLFMLMGYVVFFVVNSLGGYYYHSGLLWLVAAIAFITIKGALGISLIWWAERESVKKSGILVKSLIIFVVWWGVATMVYTRTEPIGPDLWVGKMARGIVGLVVAIMRMVLWFISYKTRQAIRQKDLELANMEKMKQQAELQALHSRINPHFLYNSLNSIASLVHTDADKTEQMALSLSDFCRSAINRQNRDTATLQEEIEMVTNYLEIEKVRLGDRLNYTIEIEELLENEIVPRFLLQPLVENAVKHGVAEITGKGEIRITVKLKDGKLILTVYDNGPAFPTELISGYGLQSLHDKLELLYAGKANLNWQNGPEKCIFVTLPLKTTIRI